MTSPTLGLVGEYPGAKTNPEIISPQSILRQTVEDVQDDSDLINAVYAIGSMIVRAIEDNTTDITLDGESLARGMQSYQKRLSSVQGRSLID